DRAAHGHGGLVHGQRRQRFVIVHVAQGVGDEQFVHAADTDDVTGLGLFHFHTLQTMVAHDLENAALALLAVGTDGHHRGVGLDLAAVDAANADHAEEAVVVQLGDLHLERAVQFYAVGGQVVDDCLDTGIY